MGWLQPMQGAAGFARRIYVSVKNQMQTHAVIPTVRLGNQLDDEE